MNHAAQLAQLVKSAERMRKDASLLRKDGEIEQALKMEALIMAAQDLATKLQDLAEAMASHAKIIALIAEKLDKSGA